MITKDMIIADVIRRHPETIEVFQKFGLSCMECQIADLEDLLRELNRVAQDKR
jgi:hybrid cluster-associated redox disulfide protein